jgi:hypothetical protein
MMKTPSREAWLETLRSLLGDAFTLQQKGALGARIGRAYGMVDGYMRALVDLGLATQNELGRVVAEERTRRLGPASTSVVAEPASDTLAA